MDEIFSKDTYLLLFVQTLSFTLIKVFLLKMSKVITQLTQSLKNVCWILIINTKLGWIFTRNIVCGALYGKKVNKMILGRYQTSLSQINTV